METAQGKRTVGASLLAIADCQATPVQAEPLLSRAGSLPQGCVLSGGRGGFKATAKPPQPHPRHCQY
ncbi:hypothetical protein FHJ31_06005 [Pseudomonas sp. Fig-3]|nr:hypothetical protein FHJ31_06005 [Pseudomonas sp. Fig-3]